MKKHVYIRLTKPEDYEDCHPDLILEDAGIPEAFEPTVYDVGEENAELTAKIAQLEKHQKNILGLVDDLIRAAKQLTVTTVDSGTASAARVMESVDDYLDYLLENPPR